MEMEYDSLNALDKGAQRLGCELIRGKTEYNWWGYHVGDYPLPEGMTKEQMGKCNHVIRIPNAKWEIGVIEQSNGKYQLIYDFYGEEGRKIESVCGKELGKIKGAYTIESLKEKLAKKKAKIKETQNGRKIRLTIDV